MKDYYKEKRVSNSSLSYFQISPRYFKDKFEGMEDESTPSYFIKGQQTHMYILEPEEFDKTYVFLDYETPKSTQQKEFCTKFANLRKGLKDEKLITAYRHAYTTKESDEKVLEKAKNLAKDYQSYIKYIKTSKVKEVLPNNMLYVLNETKQKILEHKLARKLLYDEENILFGNTDKMFIKNELPIYWKYPELELPCKSMLDRLIIDHEKKEIYMVDLKTTTHMSEFKDKAREYKYQRQLAFYWMALHWYFKNELKLDPSEYVAYTYIVAVTTRSPVDVRVFKVMEPTLRDGLIEIEQLMPELKWHFDNDQWDHSKRYYDGDGFEIL